ncbi:hypothetical protein Tco_0089209, partial [Tanacetum coccineum]
VWLFSYLSSFFVSSEDSIGTPAGRVILFGTIPTTILDTTPVITPPTTQTDTPIFIRNASSDSSFETPMVRSFFTNLPNALRDRGIEARVVVEADDRDETNTGVKGPVEVRVKRVTHPVMPEDISEPAQEGAVEATYDTLGDLVQRFHDHTQAIPVHRIQTIEGVQREQGHRMIGVESTFIALTERIAELERDNMRLRGTVSVEMSLADIEAVKMPNTRSGASMTRAEFEELVNRRVAEEMEAREAARTLEPLNENGDEQEGENGGNGNGGNGGNGNGGNGEKMKWKIEIGIHGIVKASEIPPTPGCYKYALSNQNQFDGQEGPGFAARTLRIRGGWKSNIRDNRGQQRAIQMQNTSGQKWPEPYTARNKRKNRICLGTTLTLISAVAEAQQFDRVADRSFNVQLPLVHCLMLHQPLKPSYAVELADGRISEANVVLRGHKLRPRRLRISRKRSDLRMCQSYGNFQKSFQKNCPGLPPTRQVEFQIDLVPGASTCSTSTVSYYTIQNARGVYSLQELSLTEGLKGQIPHTWGAPVLFVKKKRCSFRSVTTIVN